MRCVKEVQVGLSAVVITFNEEANIERCLRGVAFADEIVVLDSFSTDQTAELARKFTDRVSFRPFTNYSEQKAAALALAREDWVLLVDADEVVSGALAAEIKQAIESSDFDGYRIPRSTYFAGRRMRYCGWYPDYQLRLARRSKARIPQRLVHETLVVDGRCGTLANPLVHYSYPTIDDYMRKMIPYARAAALQKLNEGRTFKLTDLLFKPGLALLKMYLVKQGFRDGLHGFVLSVLTACSTALRYAMLWQMSRAKGCEQGADQC